jgi:hypothetical protein
MIRYFVLALAVSPLAISPGCPTFPRANLSPSSVNFSPQVVRAGSPASAPQTVTLTSSGSAALKITKIESSGDFSQTNDCPMDPNTIAPNATCTIQVTFAPNVIGNISGAVTITDNGIGNPHVLPLSGTGLPPVGFLPTSVDFGTVVVNTTSTAQTVTLTNNQGVALNITGISASGDYSLTHNCSSSLAAGQSCNISVSFHPTTAGAVPGALTVSTDASLGAQPVGLTGSGSGSATSKVDLSPASLAFGNHEAGATSGGKTVTLTNTGNTSLSIQSISVSSTCGTLVSAGGSCSITVKFQPSADFANVDYPGAITIIDSDATSPQVAGLSGTGVQPISAFPAAMDFGTIDPNTTATDQSVTITNNHNAAEDVSITTSGHFDLSSNGCTQSLAPGVHCEAKVGFTSAYQEGVNSGAMTLSGSSAGFLRPTVVGLSACATRVAVSPRNFNFGAVPAGTTSDPATTTIVNTGSDLNISGISVTGTDSGDFVISNNTCGSTLPSDGSCTLEITYKPQASGSRTAALNISDDGACSPQQETLTGGSSAGPFTIFVNNESGGGTITSIPAGINCNPRTATPICSASFASGTSVTLTATPDEQSLFSGWSGACTGTGSCVLDMDSDKQVTAAFKSEPRLVVEVSGTGSGKITSNPAGIDCPVNNCSSTFSPGTSVTLTAAADSNSAFAGWNGGGCSGTGKCTLTLNTDQDVTAIFNSTAPDFSMSASSAAPGTVSAGQSAQSTVTITSVNAFNSEVKFTCSVDPAPALAPTCSMNPPSVTPATNGSVNSTLTVSTTAASASVAPARGSLFYALSLPLAGIAWFTVGLPSRKKKIRLAVLLVCSALTAGVLLETSCGGAGTKPTHGVGTPANTYTITVIGAAGSTQHSRTTTLTVQ